jgi:putative transcriptional regulator
MQRNPKSSLLRRRSSYADNYQYRRDACPPEDESGELASRIGITPSNMSILKTGKAKALRISTLEALCRELDCQPGDILEYTP